MMHRRDPALEALAKNYAQQCVWGHNTHDGKATFLDNRDDLSFSYPKETGGECTCPVTGQIVNSPR